MNALREKFKSKKKLYGTLVCLTDPCLCEIMGNAGYDCVWVDTEHTYISYKEVLCHLTTAKSAGIPTVVRLPQNDLTAAKKILEMGPDGIIFPMVRSYDEFKSLLEMTLYPPHGTRGFGPMRAIGYGSESALEYVQSKSLETCRFMQIESITMIDDLEKIAENPFIDGFIFGPNDLSGSLGEFLNVFGDATVTKIKRAIEILRRHNKIIGLAGGMDEKAIKFWSQLDLDILFCGGDWNFLFEQSKATLKFMKETFK